jgi:hypothetical protein
MILPIDALSAELLDVIFEEAVHASPSINLLSCLLTCKLWYIHARRLLYRDAVLNNTQLTKFVSRSDFFSDFLIRTVSISLDAHESNSGKQLDQNTLRLGSPSAHELWIDLENLISKIEKMSNLNSFSFVTKYRESVQKWAGFWIPSAIIQNILDKLPPSCVNLEIEMGRNMPGYTSGHVSSSISKLFPQLKYLRLRLPVTCPNICDDGKIMANNLEQLIIITDLYPINNTSTFLCGSNGQSSRG